MAKLYSQLALQMHQLYCLLPLIGTAAVVRWYAGSSQAKPSSTAALSGFRFILDLTVFFDHAGIHWINGAASFIVLSAAVLSLSRRGKEPGQLKKKFDSCHSVASFMVPRLCRILPGFWFRLVYQSVVGGTGKNVTGPIEFLRRLIPALFTTPAAQPTDFLTITYNHDIFWFVQVITILYMIFPLLELLIFGVGGCVSQRRLWNVLVICYLAKLLIIGLMAALVPLEWNSWYAIDTPWPKFLETVDGLNGSLSLFVFMPLRIPEFAIGMVIPHLVVFRTGEQESESSVLLSCNE